MSRVQGVGAVAVTLAMATALLTESTASAPASHSFPTFFTPRKLAFCKFQRDLAGVGAKPYLNCWRARDGFTVTMEATGRPLHGPLKENKGPVQSVTLPRWLLPFGHGWWGNRRGDEGRGRAEGRVLFRCMSRTTGLICHSIVSGHGFWLGRVRGHRIF